MTATDLNAGEGVPPNAYAVGERVLVLTPTGRDAAVITEVLGRAGIEALPYLFPDLIKALADEPIGALIVAEEALPTGCAAKLTQALSAQPAWSDLPVILLIAHRRAGANRPARLAGELTALLLERPLDQGSLVSIVNIVLRGRRRQYEIRDHLHEQARVRTELERADRSKDEFLAMLAHELRNPLGPIRNASALLQRLAPADSSFMKISEMIARQSAHMARLLDDLLDVSRITRGKVTLITEPLDAAMIAHGALEVARPLMESRRHNLRLTFPSTRLWVEGDATRLTQVLGNVLLNAGKYTPSGGEITLTLDGTNEDVIYRVCDNGVGLDTDLLPRVFDLFSQAESALDRTEGGLGIGLALVKGLVEMHGGSVAAVSEGRGKGAEFIIRLPRLNYTEAARDGAGQNRATASARLRVLVADDNADHAESIAMLLRSEGHNVRIAHDGRAALELAQEFKPQAAMLDIGLPRLNGYELARELRESSDGVKLLLIAITGYGQAEDRERSKFVGFDYHLVKPVNPNELSALLNGPATAEMDP